MNTETNETVVHQASDEDHVRVNPEGVAVTEQPAVRRTAYHVADNLGSDFEAVLENSLESDEVNDRVPLFLTMMLREKFPRYLDEEGTKENDDWIGNWPYPGTKEYMALEDGTKIPVNNADEYSFTGDDNKQVKASYYGDMFDRTATGRAIDGTLSQMSSAKNNNDLCEKTVKHPNGTVTTLDEYIEMYDGDRQGFDAEKQRWVKRRTRGVARIRRAVQISFQIDRVEKELPRIKVRFASKKVPNGDGTFRKELMITTKPVILSSSEEAGYQAPVTLGQFLAMDVDKANEKGGTLAAFVGTSRKRNNEQPGGKTVKRITTVDQLFSAINMINQFLDGDSDDGKMHRASFLKALSDKSSDDKVQAVFTLVEALDVPYSAIAARAEKLMAMKAGRMAPGEQSGSKREALVQAFASGVTGKGR